MLAVRTLMPARKLFSEPMHLLIKDARVLDIGVGGGRTSLHLMGECRTYIGLDYSAPMIEACRARFPFCKEAFSVGDARDLRHLGVAQFDLVLFAFAGLDSVGHEDRQKILSEVHAVLDDEGLFFFSTHSLHAFPFDDAEAQARNAHLDPVELRTRGWVQLTDKRADVFLYYVYPDFQVRQLQQAGFEVIETIDMNGKPFDFRNPPRDWLVTFLCRKV
ncbi:class I SAM-dependent methyltransferase [Hyphomicrobium sp. D-2]|uniref:class I SAM-dependent methyltransferase n=1 Tax=Hyphomicrobium sp. D-2 TaxID=3041621 RepID=UPI0024590CB6|nr:class I SAM-dependent methyltransferase [Hyphomicrobium sp. D-2]MDH4981174.1 class I SAM-dependent methyltransferase [Hyphomicrobium sp. D-2]